MDKAQCSGRETSPCAESGALGPCSFLNSPCLWVGHFLSEQWGKYLCRLPPGMLMTLTTTMKVKVQRQ